MVRRIWSIASVLLFVLGMAGLGLTYYAWFGAWPVEMKALVDHQRSVARNSGEGPDPLLIGIPDRARTRSLAGSWPAVIDLYGRGDALGIAPLAREPRTPSDIGEFSFENGLALEVPGDWNTQDPRLVFYQGVVWYKRLFDATPAPGRRFFLHFGAANYHASVYVNGLLLGVHEGGFTPFNFEVTDVLREGENLLVVKVDNRREEGDVPTPLTDWHNYGGLTREVTLVEVPETFVRSWEVRLDREAPGRLVGFVQVDGPARDALTLEIPDLDLRATLRPDATGRAEIELEADPERWSPDAPRLYDVIITAGEERVVDRIGFRIVETRGSEILLNGKPIFLRGISAHEEAIGGGRIRGPEDARAIFDVLEDLGVNFVRLAHYTHDESMLREADRRGIVVWGEIPVYWSIAFDSAETLGRARTQLSEMIERDRNRASVLLWSIGNETPHGEERDLFMAALAEHVRAEDPSRLVTAALLTGPEALIPFMSGPYSRALLGFPPEQWIFEVNDPLGDVVDVLALNEYFGWYYSGAVGFFTPFSSHWARRAILDNLDRVELAFAQDKPVIVSEMGAGALAGFHAPVEDIAVYSEEFQALVYERQLEMIRRQPMVAGLSPWVLKDFRSPMRLYQGIQDYWNRKGLIAPDGTRKLAFGVLQDFYRSRAAADGPAS
jgi:beta-glucuronidase